MGAILRQQYSQEDPAPTNIQQSIPSIPITPGTPINVVPLETVQTLIGNIAPKPNEKELSIIDRKGLVVSVDQYEDMKKRAIGGSPSDSRDGGFGEKIEKAINQKFSDEFIGNIVGKMFGGADASHAAKKDGFVGMMTDLLNTQFAYGAGQAIGNRAPELVAALGKDRIDGIVNAYNNKMNPNGGQQPEQQQQQISPEEQQKKTENTIMSLDSTNTEHVTSFMQATGIKDYISAQRTILVEQSRILKARGLSEEPDQNRPPEQRSNRPESTSQPKDLNRQLIDQYDNPNSNAIENSGNANPFFWDTQKPAQPTPFENSFEAGSSTNESEFIMSLNPDDPISQQQYMAARNLSDLPLDSVKKMMIKEQKALNSGKSDQPQVSDNKSENVDSITPLLGLLEKMDKNFESGLKSLNEKIGILENEITVLKKDSRRDENIKIVSYNDVREDTEENKESLDYSNQAGLSDDDPANIENLNPTSDEKYDINNVKVEDDQEISNIINQRDNNKTEKKVVLRRK